MNNKIIGILVCTLMIAATVLPVTGTMNVNKNQLGQETLTENEEKTDSTFCVE